MSIKQKWVMESGVFFPIPPTYSKKVVTLWSNILVTE